MANISEKLSELSVHNKNDNTKNIMEISVNNDDTENTTDDTEVDGEINDGWIKVVCKWFNHSKGWGFLNIVKEDKTISKNKEKKDKDIKGKMDDIKHCTDIKDDIANCTDDETECTDDITNYTENLTECTDDITNSTEHLTNCKDNITECTDDKPNCTDDLTNCTDDISDCAEDITDCTEDITECTDIFVHQSAIVGEGWRYLKPGEIVFIKLRKSERGWEASAVRGDGKSLGGRRPLASGRRVRCFNCGDVTRHRAADCPKPPLPKRCYFCKSENHLIDDCTGMPNDQKQIKTKSGQENK